MPAVELIVCPFDLGKRNWRCGQGPDRILGGDLVPSFEADGAVVHVSEVEPLVNYYSESAMVFDAQRKIAGLAKKAVTEGRMPLVLGGNCLTAIGGISGVGAEDCSLLWFDAHGDFCTSETSVDGFLDGMGMAMATGRCWRNALSTIPGFAPIPESLSAIVGARDLDPWESEDLARSAISVFGVKDLRAKSICDALDPFLANASRTTSKIYVHVDIDVHDPSTVPANYYNAPGGLEVDEVLEAIEVIGAYIRIAGGGLASYDPSFDPEGKTIEVANKVLRALLRSSDYAHGD